MSSHSRPAAGGGRVIEVAPDRLPGWLTRFGARHGGWAVAAASLSAVTVMGADGASARLAAPFPPMRSCGDEPVASLLDHIASLGELAALVVRERAYSIGICRAGVVVAGSTDTRYVQSRTAAGGWSQQRYARRRGNQRRDSYRAAADTAARVWADRTGRFAGLIAAGEKGAIGAVLSDPRLAAVAALPRRTFLDVAEPRRAVLEAVAARALTIEVTIRDAAATSDT